MSLPQSFTDVETTLHGAFDWLVADGSAWGLWLAVGVGGFVALRFMRAIISGFMRSSKKPEYDLRNILADAVSGTSSLYLLVFALASAAPFFLTFPEKYAGILPTALKVLTIYQLVVWIRIFALGLLDGALSRQTKDERSAVAFRSLVGIFLNIGLFAIAAIMILNNLGVDATGLIAGLGVGGIAIGLAAQSLFEDLFAGMSIMIDRPFVRGDFISFKGFNGTVEKVGLKTTRLRALSGEQLSVTNSSLLTNEIQNYKLMRERRIAFRVGVTYQTPHDKLQALPDHIRGIVEGRVKCRFDRCHLASYGDSAILFECVYFVLSPDYAEYMDEQQAIYLAVHKLFEDKGLEFAYPTQTIFVEKADT